MYFSSSVSNSTITFYQGDGTTEQVTIDNVENTVSASYALTASYAETFNATTVISNIVSASYIQFNVTADQDAPEWEEGVVYYNAEDGALTVYNDEADISLQVGQEFWIRVYNGSDGPILNGTPVRASGSQGDRIVVYPALAEDHTSGPVFDNHILGLATHTIESSTEGYVTAQGIVRGVDTTEFTAGDILYLQTGSVGLRNTPPPFPYDIVQVGYVARSQQNGFIFVEPKEPVHFSNISGLSGSYTPEIGDLWVYQSNNSWTHTKTLSGSYEILNGDLSLNSGNIELTGSLLQSGSDSYFLGNVGIETTTPGYTLDVNGSFRATSITETSAQRFKENIKPLDSQLDKINQMNPVSFDWKDDNRPDIGFIAEDIEKVYPELVSYQENQIEGIQYTKFTAVLVKALQEQQKQIDELKKEIFILKQQ